MIAAGIQGRRSVPVCVPPCGERLAEQLFHPCPSSSVDQGLGGTAEVPQWFSPFLGGIRHHAPLNQLRSKPAKLMRSYGPASPHS